MSFFVIHFPVIFKIGRLVIPAHTVMEMLAYFMGIRLYFSISRKKKDHYSIEDRLHLLIGAAAGALLGSRIVGVLDHPFLALHPPSFMFYLQTKSIVGGILGAIVGVEAAKKWYLKKSQPSGDVFTFPLILGMSIGRIGCFLTGVSDSTVGKESHLPWAMYQGDPVLRHPTSLYDIVFLTLLGFLLYGLQKKFGLKNGALFRFFVIAYLIYRFFIEYLKPITPIFTGLSSIQLASLLGGLAYSWSLWKIYFKAGGIKQESEPLAEN